MVRVVYNDRDVHPVADVELGEQPRFVLHDGGLAHEPCGGDFRIRGVGGDSADRRLRPDERSTSRTTTRLRTWRHAWTPAPPHPRLSGPGSARSVLLRTPESSDHLHQCGL